MTYKGRLPSLLLFLYRISPLVRVGAVTCHSQVEQRRSVVLPGTVKIGHFRTFSTNENYDQTAAAVELVTGYSFLHFCYPPLGASTIHMFGSIVPHWRRIHLNMHYVELPIPSTPSCHCKHECSKNILLGTRFRTLSAARL